jgi:two-component system, cell cycle response regulator CpdR
MLEDLGCEVVTAAGGRRAIDTLLADDRIEVLITDVDMPDMDGFTMAQAATRMRKELKVIILSGRESDGRGFPLIRKPFMQDDLKRTMAQHTGLC